MNIINNKTVVVSNFKEFKTILTENNTYTYVYLDNDINIEESFIIGDKSKIIIDGTYNTNTHTITNNLIDSTISTSINSTIIFKNIKITSSNKVGFIYINDDLNSKIVFSNTRFNGVKLLYNQYGITKIIDSYIKIEDTNNITSDKVCECNNILIGGNSDIDSNNTPFIYLHTIDAYFKILSNSRVNITSKNAFFNGTPRLDFKISRCSELNLITGNGFAQTIGNGCQDVLIDDFSKLNFIENSHQRVPMWNIYGNLTVNEGASLLVINSYENTPIDNYNIYFKGNNQNIKFNNPRNIVLYTKNSNVLYTNNPVNFEFTFNRINMWKDSKDLLVAGGIEDLPLYSWYKKDALSIVKGTFDKNTTNIIYSNYTNEEKNILPSLDNFSFQNKKQFSIGQPKINIHPINSNSTKISGHTTRHADVSISFDGTNEIVKSDENGLFEYLLENNIQDNTVIKITSAAPTSYMYLDREIITPFNGEVTLLESTKITNFDISLHSENNIYNKIKPSNIIIIDSRNNATNYELFINYVNPLMSDNNKVLIDSLIFKKNDEILQINTQPSSVYQNNKNIDEISIKEINYEKDKGLLLKIDDTNLNEEYYTKYIWSIVI